MKTIASVAILTALLLSTTPAFAEFLSCIQTTVQKTDAYLNLNAKNGCGSDVLIELSVKRASDGSVDETSATAPKCKDTDAIYQAGPEDTIKIWGFAKTSPNAPDCDKAIPLPQKEDLGSRIKSRLKPAQQRAIASEVRQGDFYKDAYDKVEEKREADRKAAATAAAAAPPISTPPTVVVPSAARCFDSWPTCRDTCQQVSTQARDCPSRCSRNEHEEGGEIVGPFCY